MEKRHPIPLDSNEKLGLASYWNEIGFAGIDVIVVSDAPDDIIVNASIIYDPQISQADIKATLKVALDTFLISLPFDGVLSIDSLERAMMDSLGIVEVDLEEILVKPVISTTYESITTRYQPYSGHLSLNPNSPVLSDLNYTPNV